MFFYGLIVVVFFFLVGVIYDCIYIFFLVQMGNIGKVMFMVFVFFIMGVMVFLVLFGMSGFVSELVVFVGVSFSDIYSIFFKMVIVFLVVVGLVFILIYLLFMLC